MAVFTKAVRDDLCYEAFKVLAQHPEGLNWREVYKAVERSGKIPPELMQPKPNSPGTLRYYDLISYNTIGQEKAGWLIKEGGKNSKWRLTEAGQEALKQYPSVEAFSEEVGRRYTAWKQAQGEINANAEAPALNSV
jgi:hypothetical protein